MTRQVVMVPFACCGAERPVVVVRPSVLREALTRKCKRCGNPRTKEPRLTVQVPCVGCGVERPLTGDTKEIAKASTRPCRKCAHPTRTFRHTELVPCIYCGIERPITGTYRRVFEEAAERPCIECTRNPQDVDDMAVERLISGSPVRSTRAEREAAVHLLTQQRMTARVIAERLHVSARTVVRLRARVAA